MFYCSVNSLSWVVDDMPNKTLIGYLALLSYNILEAAYALCINVGGPLNNYKLLSVINMVTAIESKLLNINIELDYKTIKMICRCLLANNILTIVYVVLFQQWIYFKTNISEKFAIGYTSLAELQLLLKYMVILLIAKQFLKAINSHIFKFYINTTTPQEHNLRYKREMIKKIGIIYGEFFKLITKFNSLISINLVFLFASLFAFMVLEIFICSAKFDLTTVTEFKISSALSITTIVYCVLFLLCYIFTAELYYKEVAEFKRNLLKLMLHSRDERLRQEVCSLNM